MDEYIKNLVETEGKQFGMSIYEISSDNYRVRQQLSLNVAGGFISEQYARRTIESSKADAKIRMQRELDDAFPPSQLVNLEVLTEIVLKSA